MIPYFCVFSTAFLLVCLTEFERHIKNTKAIQLLFLFLALVVLSLLAAFRGDDVGSDVHTYVIRFFDGAKSSSGFLDYLSFNTNEYVEPGYKFINYIVSRFTGDLRVLHFCIMFINATFICAYLWENRSKMSISLGMLVFMLMQYNYCYNAVRQSMAICVCLYSLNSARDRKLIKYCILMLLAFLFHRSSLIMCFTYPLIGLLKKRPDHEKKWLIFILSLVSGVSLIFVNSIVAICIKIGVFPVKFLHYIGNSFSISRLSVLVFVIPAALLLIMYRSSYFESDLSNYVLCFYIVLWPLLAQLDSVSDQFGRIALFFSIANIGIFAQFPKFKSKIQHRNNYFIFLLLIVSFLLVYWIVNYAVWNVGETVPYIFKV